MKRHNCGGNKNTQFVDEQFQLYTHDLHFVQVLIY